MKQKGYFVFLLIISMLFFLQSCNLPLNLEIPNLLAHTPTSTPTNTPFPPALPTNTLIPTRTVVTYTPYPTQDPLKAYLSFLPELDEGYSWKLTEDMKVIQALPDGWFYSREHCPVLNFFGTTYISREEIQQVCISRENLQEVDKYTIGQSVLKFSDLEDATAFSTDVLAFLGLTEGGDVFIYNADQDLDEQGYRSDVQNIHTTTNILESWNYTGNADAVIHHLRVNANYPYADKQNQYKTVQYSTLVINDDVYMIITETPIEEWNTFLENYGLVLEYTVVFGEKE